MRHKSLKFVVLLALTALLLPVSSLALTTSEMSGEIMCTCGCTMVLNTCSCGTADDMRSEIDSMIGQGKSKDEIINIFVSQYGEKILSSPPRRGFNLVAYIAPGFGLLIGMVVAVFLVRRWRFSRLLEEEEEAEGPGISDEMLEKIRRELKMLEEV